MTIEEILEQLDRPELSGEELEQLDTAITARLAALRGQEESAGVFAEMHALGRAGDKLQRRFATRERMAAAAESVTASGDNRGGAVRRMARRSKPSRSPEQATPEANRAVLTAAGALDRFGVRGPIEDREQLARAMCELVNGTPRHGPPRGDVLCASARWEYPPDRQLNSEDWRHNERVFNSIVGPQALTATGGVCLPVNVDYAVPTWATADRPIRDALPAYQASRGGLRYVQPPDIAGSTGLGAGGGLSAGTGIWTEATDASPGAATKPVVSIVCGTEQLVYVEAISTRLGFGNLQSRFAPEQIAANTDLAVAGAAHVAEQELLNRIAANCTQTVAQPASASGLGTAREFLRGLEEATAAIFDAHRLSEDTVLTGIFPRWFKRMIRADLASQMAVASNDTLDPLAPSDEYIENLFAVRGVRPIWHLDGQTTSAPGLSGATAQYFATQTASGNILTFPTTMVWYLFPEGTMQFLDGGRLDLGVVRDSTLDATNDYETFVETFEAIAFRGFAGAAIQFISTLVTKGGSGATVTVGQSA